MKTHLNFATTDLAKSVEFYSTLLNAKPTKLLNDYALFITDEPGLELALDLRDSVLPTRDMHFGLYVENTEEVEKAVARLELAGIASSIEREVICCYANQTKVWAIDPEGRRWEVYTVHEDTEEPDTALAECCGAKAEAGSVCCAA